MCFINIYAKFMLNGCPTPLIQLKPRQVEDAVLKEMQKRVSALHKQKSELDKKMQTMCRKRKAIDTKPLEEPMKQWDKLTVQEKHDIAAAMIDVVLISDETGIEVRFSI